MGFIRDIGNLIRGKSHSDHYGLYSGVEGVQFDKKGIADFLRYNDISLYTSKALEKRAEKVGEVEFVLRKGEVEQENHPLLELLNRPNNFHTGAQFWKLYQNYFDIAGGVFIYVDTSRELFSPKGVPSALHFLRPDLVTVLFNEGGSEIVGFKYQKPNGGETVFKPFRYVNGKQEGEVIYSFNPDPLRPLHGRSLLTPGARAIETEVQISEYHAKILQNGGKVEGVFKFKATTLTREQIKELKERYEEQYAGAKKAGTPLFLGGDAEYDKVGLTPDELSYMEAKKVSLDDISILTGVPRAILSNFTDVKFDNADAARSIFLRETIKPLLSSLTTFLDWRLIPDELSLDFVDPTPEDVDRKISLLKAGSETSALTTNEKRDMLGLDSLDGGDTILAPFNLAPLGEAPREQEKSIKTKSFEHPLSDPFVRKRYGELMVKRMDREEERFAKVMRTYFTEQEKRLVLHIQGAKSLRRKDMIDESFNQSLEIELAEETVLPVIKDMVLAAGVNATELVGYSDFDFTLSTEIAGWIDSRAALFSEQITDTTFEKLKSEFTESLDAGESRQDLVKRIENTYDGFSEGRAEVIARTEVHGAMQKGALEGYKQAGIPIKIWVTVGDAKVRDSHASVDGEERPIGVAFSNGLMFPGDPSASASETVNCRCVI